MGLKIDKQRDRGDLLNMVRQVAVNAGMKIADVQESTIMLPILLVNGIPYYELGLDGKKPSQDGKFVADSLILNKNDAFVAHEIGFYATKAKIVGGKESLGNALFYSYIDENVWAAGAGAEAEDMNALFGARLSFQTNQDVRREDIPCRDFWAPPVTQRNLTNKTLPSGPLHTVGLDSSLVYQGGQNNMVKVVMTGTNGAITPTAPTTAGYCNVAVVVMKGHLVKGGNETSFLEKWVEYTSAKY